MEITLKDLKELFENKEQKTGFEHLLGKNVFIRTVTHHYTGKCEAIGTKAMLLSSVAWIADDGRFNEAIKNSEFSEVEPYPDGLIVSIGLGAIIDACSIFKLPREVK